MSISVERGGFLLDTNIISEVSRPEPDTRAMAWLANTEEDKTFLSVATLAEINLGILRLASGKRRQRLENWLARDLVARFNGRILIVDLEISFAWGEVVARSASAGRPIEAMDALIAATAMRHGLTLVTRDIGDFAALPLTLLNPWDAPAP
jgi:hypothetical protein